MRIRQLRTGNLVIYEACYHKIKGITDNEDGKPAILTVRAVNHPNWEEDRCGIEELQGIPIEDKWLRRNRFLKSSMFPDTYIYALDTSRVMIYNTKSELLTFDNGQLGETKKVPWPVTYVHQLQNACEDMEWNITVEP